MKMPNPEIGATWLDTSTDPPVFRRWNGTEWQDDEIICRLIDSTDDIRSIIHEIVAEFEGTNCRIGKTAREILAKVWGDR